MQFLVDTFKCEWSEVVADPERQRWFSQFINTDQSQRSIEFIPQGRGQTRPADWPKQLEQPEEYGGTGHAPIGGDPEGKSWVRVAAVADFPPDGGLAVKYGSVQLAVFNFSSRGQAGEWYATQNMCPHKNAFVLSRGLMGDQAGEPKVACPNHKKTFSLRTGESLSGDPLSVTTFPVKVEGGEVYLELPSQGVMEAAMGTEKLMVTALSASSGCGGVCGDDKLEW